jgi:hypothetical protein
LSARWMKEECCLTVEGAFCSAAIVLYVSLRGGSHQTKRVRRTISPGAQTILTREGENKAQGEEGEAGDAITNRSGLFRSLIYMRS